MNSINIYPQLRFSEFNDSWTKKTTKEIAPLQRGFDLPISELTAGEYPVVFSNGALKTHNKYMAKAPGVVTGRSGTIGKVTYVEMNFWPHNTALWVTDYCGNDPKYIYYFYYQFKLERLGTGSGVPTLNRNDVHSVIKYIPSLPEQHKIAAFLSAVDKKIQILQKKKELLEQYKKGLMQKIFSREIRFKDENGQDYPDWEEKCIGDFVKERNEYPNDYNPLYSLTIEWGMIPKSERYERSFLVKEKDRAYKIMKSDDFAFNPMNLRFGALARLKETHSVIVSKYYNVFYCNKVGYPKYFEEFLTSYNMIQYYNKMATGSLIEKRRVHFLDFVKFKFKFPAIDEQIRIANFISILDAKTNTVENQIIHTQQFKKGLLQQMFV